ncbi:MAG TPA: cytochrome c [Vicinamibacteria bacterium]|nr:cytochrome c [Vicinamibacteria bacterium]
MLRFAMAALGAALLVRAEARAADSANPYGGNTDAVRAGRKLVARHCASCHGEDGRGGRSAPPLDSVAVRRAAAGDLFWLLTNGDLRAGMPSWSNLPDARRWQIVAFLQSPDPPPPAP